MKITCYLRVSTEQQELKSQKLGILEYLEKNQIHDVTWLQDTISGSTSWESRKLKTILLSAEKGDKLIVSELSRIGRSTVDVLQFMKMASEKGLLIHAVKNGVTLDDSIQSTIFATVMGLAAEIERDFIRSRTKEGMARAKAEGKKIGRPIGRKSPSKVDKFGDEIKRLLSAKVSKVSIANILGVSRGTVDRYLNSINQGE